MTDQGDTWPSEKKLPQVSAVRTILSDIARYRRMTFAQMKARPKSDMLGLYTPPSVGERDESYREMLRSFLDNLESFVTFRNEILVPCVCAQLTIALSRDLPQRGMLRGSRASAKRQRS